MPTLYELTSKYKTLESYVIEVAESDEGTDVDSMQALIDTLDSIDDMIENKTENIIKLIKNIEGDVTAYKAEEDRLAKRRKAMENRIKGLKEYMQSMMMLAGKDKIKANVFNVRLQKSNPSVLITDPSKVPAEFREKQEDKILNAEILKRLKNNEKVEGAELAPEKKHIRIS